jgi:hypothetical protein
VKGYPGNHEQRQDGQGQVTISIGSQPDKQEIISKMISNLDFIELT